METSNSSVRGWVRDSLPDSDSSVVVRVDDDEYPIQLGFHDGECWRDLSADRIVDRVLGWMDPETAAEVLDLAGSGEEGR